MLVDDLAGDDVPARLRLATAEALAEDRAQDAQPVADRAQVALAVDAVVLDTRDLGDVQAGPRGADVISVSTSKPAQSTFRCGRQWRQKAL